MYYPATPPQLSPSLDDGSPTAIHRAKVESPHDVTAAISAQPTIQPALGAAPVHLPDKTSAASDHGPLFANSPTSTAPTSLAQASPIPAAAPSPQDIDPPEPIMPATPDAEPEAPAPPDAVLPTTPEAGREAIPEDILAGELTVTALQFEGNSVFEAQYLENQVTDGAGWHERQLTFTELLQVAEAVAAVYQQAGYTTSGAVVRIPETTRQTGVGDVVIQVIEGVVESVEVAGNQRLRTGYVRSRLPVAEGEPLNVDRLQEGLQLLQLNPLIQQVNAELTAGSGTGSSLLAVQVEEAPSFSLPVRLDNSRSPSIGSFQRQVTLSEGNLLGFGDRITLGYSNTEGSDVIDFGYAIPLNAADGTLSVRASQTWNDVVESPFFDIDDDDDGPDIESESTQIEVSFRQPVIRSIQAGQFQELALGLTGSYRNSQSFLFGDPFRFSLSSDVDGTTTVTALRFFQDYTLQDDAQVLALRSQFSLGIDALGATIQEAIPGVGDVADGEFLAWRGQGQWVRRLAPDTVLLLRSNLQFADRSLVSSEQFSLGGIGTVRGYRQDELLTDNGLFASAEVRLPILRVPEWQGTLQLAPFADFGVGWNSGDQATPNPNTLAAVGLGLQWQMGDRNDFTARLDWGIPLVSVDSRGDSWQEQGLHLTIGLNLF